MPVPQPPAPFIVGNPRSGTTLLRLMLDAHPALAIPPETHFVPEVAAVCARSRQPREAFLQAVTGSPRWMDQHLSVEDLRERVMALPRFDTGEALRAFYRLYAARFGKPRWGDKTPGYMLQMRAIHRVLPEARFIHLIRDGRDVALSIKDLWFGPNSVEEAARWWVSRIQEARKQARRLPHYHEVRYEDLVAEPGRTLREIAVFLDLPWDAAMLAYHQMAGERMGEINVAIQAPDGKRLISGEERLAMHTRTVEPPQTDRVERWRREMAPAERQRFEAIAGKLLQKLGYPLS